VIIQNVEAEFTKKKDKEKTALRKKVQPNPVLAFTLGPSFFFRERGNPLSLLFGVPLPQSGKDLVTYWNYY